jgi:predicted nucleotidyltransferase
MDRDALVERLRGLRPRLAADGVTHLALFGSRARGDHREDSDLDVLIEVEEGRKFSLLDLVGVQHTLGDAIGLEVSATMRRNLSPRFQRAIGTDILDVF